MKAYGAIELTQANPPQSFEEPVTIAEMKDWLRYADPTDTSQDMLLYGLITAAREIAEVMQGKDLVLKQYDLHLDLLLGHDAVAGAAYPLRFNSIYNFGVGYDIPLRHPLYSVDLFRTTDQNGVATTLAENTDYKVDKNRSLVCPPFGKIWPFYTPDVTSSVLIRFTSGYASSHPFWANDGQRVITGIKLLVTQWFEGRLPMGQELPAGVMSLLQLGARPRAY